MINAEKTKLALVLLLLTGLTAIGFGTALAVTNAGPEVSIPSNIAAQANSIVSIPVYFTGNGNNVASLAFSIDYDETWLNYDASVPNAITFNLPNDFQAQSCTVDLADTDGEIDCIVFDPMIPLAALPDGNFLTIKLRTLNASENTTAAVNFSLNPVPSFGNTEGQSVTGTSGDGSVKFGPTSWFSYLPLLLKQSPVPVTPTPVTPTPVTPTPVTPTPVTPTPVTPTPVTPTPGCDELIVNGDIEDTSDKENDGKGWELPVTAYSASFSSLKYHSETRSILTGIFDINNNTYSWSSATQIVTIPASTDTATLTFWNYPRSGESTIQRLSTSVWGRLMGITPNTPFAFDIQYVAVEDLTAGTDAEVVFWQISNSRDWEEVQVDLSAYAGHQIKLWFTTYNDGYGGVTSMFIDDVSLEVCE